METTKDIANEWQSVYTGINVISNRLTPAHRDSKGRPEWFNTLANYCDGDSQPRLQITDLGLDLEYSSGTVVGFVDQYLNMRFNLGALAIGFVKPTL